MSVCKRRVAVQSLLLYVVLVGEMVEAFSFSRQLSAPIKRSARTTFTRTCTIPSYHITPTRGNGRYFGSNLENLDDNKPNNSVVCYDDIDDGLDDNDNDDDDDDDDDIISNLIERKSDEDDEDEECSIFNLDACSDAQVIAMSKRPPSPARVVKGIDNNNNNNGIDIYNYYNADTNGNTMLALSQYLKELVKQPITEVILVGLVLLSCFVVGVATLSGLPASILAVCQAGEAAISVIFTVEYILRWYLKGFSPSYVLQPLAIIDLIAILPGVMQIVSMMGLDVPASLMGGALINLRLLRVLRLQRVLRDYETFCKFEQALGLDPSEARPYQLQLARVVISIFTLLSVTAGLIYSAEHAVNPDIPDYFTALYFALTTISTVGFGDISPVTTAGRCAVSASILIGVAVVPAQAAALAEALLLNQQSSGKSKDKTKINSTTNGAASDKGRGATTNTMLEARMGALEKRLDDTNVKLDMILKKLDGE
eukprot:scaffold2640_cov180-Amphora_coffeaeformis.AAC.4